jgi:uncharacterized protein YbjT (DUF2867 family)
MNGDPQINGNQQKRQVFVAGGTGYVGSQLIPALMARGHQVRALVREGSEGKLPAGCTVVTGDALREETYADKIAPADTFVQLVGVSHPSPAKAQQFREIDFVAARGAVNAAKAAGVRHFVYVSVAHPAPVMKGYVAVREECESLIRASGMGATILRPWYVLGPGHRWPYLLIPAYWLLRQIPSTREGARRLGLVTIEQMVAALASAVENPSERLCVVDVPQIQEFKRADYHRAATA